MAGELLAEAGMRWGDARPDRGGGRARHVHGPARGRRHRARAGAVARGRAGRRVQPAGAGRGALDGRAAGRSGAVLAVIDARRGEVFAVRLRARGDGSRRYVRARAYPRSWSPRARWRPRISVTSVDRGTQARARTRWLAVGDGAVRYRDQLESAGVRFRRGFLAAARGEREAICELGARAAGRDGVSRRSCRTTGAGPDAEIALGARGSRPGE